MNRNIQVKIILIFFILGIILISGLGISYLYMLQELENISTSQGEVISIINTQVQQTKMIMLISTGAYIVISILVSFFVTKALVSPMKKLIKSAEKIASGEKIEIEKNDNSNSEVGDLTNAFNIMTVELKQKFNEVNRQKKQIETILLHMTDGIIAFDMDGNIIHINPAAKQLLSITDNEDNFEKIFKKLKKLKEK